MNPVTLPVSYQPYKTLNFCSNILIGVKVPILVGDMPVLLVGRGKKSKDAPKIWLAAPRQPNSPEWAFVLDASVSTNRAVEVTSDDARRTLRVSVSGIRVLEVVEVDRDQATVTFVDLAPLGLAVRGDSRGLAVGGMQMSANVFQGAYAAFAFAPPNNVVPGA